METMRKMEMAMWGSIFDYSRNEFSIYFTVLDFEKIAVNQLGDDSLFKIKPLYLW